jgi:multidrug efflux pump subunit AcrA (membrane-fusion protein)
MSQPDPQAQQLSLAQQQLALQAAQAQIALNTTQAEQNRAEAAKAMVEAQLLPEETKAKILGATTKNLPSQDDLASQEFDKRIKIAELMLKEKDIENKLKVVELQTANKQEQSAKDAEFLKSIIGQ